MKSEIVTEADARIQLATIPKGINLLTTRQVSLYTGISVDALDWWRLTGTGLPYTKIGSSIKGSIRYRREDVELYIEERRIPPPADNPSERYALKVGHQDTRTRNERKADREALHAMVRKELGWD